MFKKLKTQFKLFTQDAQIKNQQISKTDYNIPQTEVYDKEIPPKIQKIKENNIMDPNLQYKKQDIKDQQQRQSNGQDKFFEKYQNPPEKNDQNQEQPKEASVDSNKAEVRWGPKSSQLQHQLNIQQKLENVEKIQKFSQILSAKNSQKTQGMNKPSERIVLQNYSKNDNNESNYLDVDEDHVQMNSQMSSLIERQNTHKLRYLTSENQQLKEWLEDAEDSILINKNMIRILVEHQENQHCHSRQKSQNLNAFESQNMVIEKLNFENYSLYKKITEFRKKNEELHGDILLKNQIVEENRINAINEIQNLESEYEGLQHKYDRKELILQNLERKLNYYEMYITKQASKYGRNDKEADIILKKFQHEKFSGGIESTDLYKLQMQDDSKLSNVVQQNIELKKQNEDLKTIIDQLGYVRDIHVKIIEKTKMSVQQNQRLQSQLQAQDNMIRDLVFQIQKQKKEGAILIAQNIALNDQILRAQQDIDQVRIEGEHFRQSVLLKNMSENVYTPEAQIRKQPWEAEKQLDDLQLDFDDEENENIKDYDCKSPFVYMTEQQYPRTQKNFNDKIEDGLPTIFEKSTIEMADQYQLVDNKMKSKTHSKKLSLIPDNFRNTDALITNETNENVNLQSNINSIRNKYRHKRLESKNALLNQYRSLSLLQGDDFSKFLQKTEQNQKNQDYKKMKDDFDDISSIYTSHAQNNKLEKTLKKRVEDREKRLSLLGFDQEEDRDDIAFIKKQIESVQEWDQNQFNQDLQRYDILEEIRESGEENTDLSKIIDAKISEQVEELMEKHGVSEEKIEKKKFESFDEEKNQLDKACSDIFIDKSSLDESQIEKNLEKYDYKDYKGIEELKTAIDYQIYNIQDQKPGQDVQDYKAIIEQMISQGKDYLEQ